MKNYPRCKELRYLNKKLQFPVLTLSFMNIHHNGESRDFKTTTKAGTIENPSIQVGLSLTFPLILIRLAWGLKKIHQKNESNMFIHCMRLSDKDLDKKLLKSNRKIWLLNQIFV